MIKGTGWEFRNLDVFMRGICSDRGDARPENGGRASEKAMLLRNCERDDTVSVKLAAVSACQHCQASIR